MYSVYCTYVHMSVRHPVERGEICIFSLLRERCMSCGQSWQIRRNKVIISTCSCIIWLRSCEEEGTVNAALARAAASCHKASIDPKSFPLQPHLLGRVFDYLY